MADDQDKPPVTLPSGDPVAENSRQEWLKKQARSILASEQQLGLGVPPLIPKTVADKPEKPGSYRALLRRSGSSLPPPTPADKQAITDATEQSERSSEKTTVAEPSKAGERPGTKTLDYIALGLLLAPPAVVFEMYVKGESIDWWRTAVATPVCWVAGGIAVLASHGWQSWRSKNTRILPFLIATESSFWGKAVIVAASIGLALALSSFLSNKSPMLSTESGFTQEQVNEKIASAVANLNSQLAEANRQRDAVQREVNVLRQTPNAPQLPNPSYDEPRIFTNKTIGELRDFYKDRTALQGAAFMADEIGKWINTEGTIQFIRPDGLVFLSGEGGIISCEFNASWNPKLSAFRPGETMKVVGKIGTGQIGVSPIYLRPCEIRG